MHDKSNGQDYLQPYEAAVAEHGPGFKATLWGTERAQRARFDVMIDLVDFADAMIVDAGCGQGDFAAHLLERDVAFGAFHGIDAMPEMIQTAQDRALDRCSFSAADFVVHPTVMGELSPNWICFSGTLNTMGDPMAQTLIRAAYDIARDGVIFNFLSNRPHARWGDRDLTPARRFDTVAWIDWALGLSSRVAWTQAYLDGHDSTILIRHDEDAA
ncbi:MAG: methyltransferase domain-containing protein [Planctomycetota bacterium]